MASADDNLRSMHAAMRDLGGWLTAAGVPGMIIGGIAVALLGRPRITRDLDAVVWLPDEKLSTFLAVGKQFGFASRFSDPVEFARQSHILAMRHVPSKVTVDVAIGALAFEQE